MGLVATMIEAMASRVLPVAMEISEETVKNKRKEVEIDGAYHAVSIIKIIMYVDLAQTYDI